VISAIRGATLILQAQAIQKVCGTFYPAVAIGIGMDTAGQNKYISIQAQRLVSTHLSKSARGLFQLYLYSWLMWTSEAEALRMIASDESHLPFVQLFACILWRLRQVYPHLFVAGQQTLEPMLLAVPLNDSLLSLLFFDFLCIVARSVRKAAHGHGKLLWFIRSFGLLLLLLLLLLLPPLSHRSKPRTDDQADAT